MQLNLTLSSADALAGAAPTGPNPKVQMMRRLLLLLSNPWCELIVGLVLVITAGYEIVTELLEDDPAQLGAHHGVTLYGTMAVLRALAHMAEGARKADNSLVESLSRT